MDPPGYSPTCVLKPAGNIISCHFLWLYWKRKKKVWVTDPERTFPRQLQILNSSQELHYQSGYNKKTLEREVLNDQRLPWKMVEKWPIYFLPPFGCLNGLFLLFSNQCTASEWTPEGRVSADNTGGRHSGAQTCWEWDKEAFHTTRPGVNALFLWGHQEALQKYEQVRRRTMRILLSVHFYAYWCTGQNQHEYKPSEHLVYKNRFNRRLSEWSSAAKWVTSSLFSYPLWRINTHTLSPTHTLTQTDTFEEWEKTSKIPEQLTNHSPAGQCDRVHTSLVDRLASVMLSVGRDLN